MSIALCKPYLARGLGGRGCGRSGAGAGPLAIPAADLDAEGLQAFTDLILSRDDEEVPLNFNVDGGLPQFVYKRLLRTPFTIRAQPPRTQGWLLPVPQPLPPPGFEPRGLAAHA